jgi:HEPN domain-containing protein
MPPEESTHPGDWLEIARKDLSRSRALLNMDDPEAAGFHLQQAIEKYLKAFLLSHGWRLKRIHDLETLLDDAIEFDPSLEEFRRLTIRVSGYYVAERYPLLTQPGIDAEDVERSIAETDILVARLDAYFAQ